MHFHIRLLIKTARHQLVVKFMFWPTGDPISINRYQIFHYRILFLLSFGLGDERSVNWFGHLTDVLNRKTGWKVRHAYSLGRRGSFIPQAPTAHIAEVIVVAAVKTEELKGFLLYSVRRIQTCVICSAVRHFLCLYKSAAFRFVKYFLPVCCFH